MLNITNFVNIIHNVNIINTINIVNISTKSELESANPTSGTVTIGKSINLDKKSN